MNSLFTRLKYLDMPLAAASGILALIGLAVLYSSSLSNESMAIFYRQLVFFLGGMVGFLALSLYNYHNIGKANRWVYVALVIILIGLLVFGRDIRGSSRWIDLGFFRFQPAEFAKLVVIIALSRWLSLRRGQINAWKNIITTFLVAGVPAVLVLLEPDLGSATIIFGIWAGLLLVSPIKRRYLAILAALFIVTAGVSWEFVLHDYQRQRVEVFLNPDLDPRGQGYNVRQAIIAVGSGGLLGRGLGQGLQSQLKFLPERQTDFIFATAAEEIGFLGCLALVIVYAFVLLRLRRIMLQTRDSLGMYIVAGVFFMFFGQIVINIGMNIGILPVTGIPLPFLSYGGSSLAVVLLSLGVVQSVVVQSKALRF